MIAIAFCLTAFVALAAASGGAAQYHTGQTFFAAGSTHSRYDEGLFTPIGDLSALDATDFTVLEHPAFPQYNVRVKESNFCDGAVRYVAKASDSPKAVQWVSILTLWDIHPP